MVQPVFLLIDIYCYFINIHCLNPLMDNTIITHLYSLAIGKTVLFLYHFSANTIKEKRKIEETLKPERVSITLKLEESNSSFDRNVGNSDGNDGNNVGNVGNDVGNRFKDFITQGEFIIYSIIKENPQISATRIASNIKLAKRGVE